MSGKGELPLQRAAIWVFTAILICICALSIHKLNEGLVAINLQTGSPIAESGDSTCVILDDADDYFIFTFITPSHDEISVINAHSLPTATAFSYWISPLLPPPNL